MPLAGVQRQERRRALRVGARPFLEAAQQRLLDPPRSGIVGAERAVPAVGAAAQLQEAALGAEPCVGRGRVPGGQVAGPDAPLCGERPFSHAGLRPPNRGFRNCPRPRLRARSAGRRARRRRPRRRSAASAPPGRESSTAAPPLTAIRPGEAPARIARDVLEGELGGALFGRCEIVTFSFPRRA